MKDMRFNMVLPFLAAFALAACDSGGPPPPQTGAPVIRLPAVPGRPGVAYFVIVEENGRGALISVSSPQAGRAEMHETMAAGTMTGMRPIARAAFENGRIAFAPGGRHVMLFDLDPALAPGGRAQLTFRFETGAPLTLAATVRAAGEDHDGH